MASWNDLGNIWNTLRELDVNAIRNEAERPLFIALLGSNAATEAVAGLLHRSQDRYPAVGIDPLARLPLGADHPDLARADLLLLVADAREALDLPMAETLRRIEDLAKPMLAVVLHGERMPLATGSPIGIASVALSDPATPQAAESLARALLDKLPGELHTAAARRLPGLRTSVARDLINNSSFTNAAYSLGSGLPEQIPILAVPFIAADLIVLTKNQALLVYKLALAYGAPPDFQTRIAEVLPVVGSGYVWRQMARSLVGIIPVWGVVLKTAVAYAGTYSTGIVAWRWYARGELVSGAELKKLTDDAMAIGRERARELMQRVRRERSADTTLVTGERAPNFFQRLFGRIRGVLPRRKKPPALPASTEAPEQPE